MKLSWDLSELFKNDQEFYQEIKNIKKMLIDIKKYDDIELDEISLFNMLQDEWKIKQRTNNVLVYGSLTYYKNINSKKNQKNKIMSEKFNSKVNIELVFIDKKILNLGSKKVNDFIKKNHKLKLYKLYLDNLYRREKHIQNNNTNKKIKNNIDNINCKLILYNNVIKNIKYEEENVDGKTIKIDSSNVNKYLCSKDRKIRKYTYLSMNQKFKDLEDVFADILDSILGYRIQNAKLEKYESVLQKNLFEENIDSNIIEILINLVNSKLPLLKRYLRIKKHLLEISHPHLYDFGAPLNNLEFKYSYEEAIKIIKNALKPLGSQYSKAIDYLLNGHIDAELNNDKHQSITFSWNTFSFMNFRGTYIDLKNLCHEIGHIVNYYLSEKNLPFIYADSTIFIGEITSSVNEILLNRYLYQNAKSKEEKIFYLNKEIENFFTSVFKQTMYTEFENELYNMKMTNKLTAKKISKKYESLIKKYYGNDFVYDRISSIEWAKLGHLYRWSYYPYKYATGLIIASTIVTSLADSKTLTKKDYLKFLASGSSLYSLQLLKILNIDFTNYDVINNGFNIMEKDIIELEKIILKEK